MAVKAGKWLKLFERFVADIRITSKEETSGDERGAPLVLWESQKRTLQEIGNGLDDGIHKFYVAKSRQLGVTTISLAIDVFWLALHPKIIGCLVADTPKNSNANRMLIEAYVKSFPDGYFGDDFRIVKSNRDVIAFSNGARLDLLVAGIKDKGTSWSEGIGYTFAHMCMAPGTPVITEHGRLKLIEDVEVGDSVLTHTGASAKVIDVLGQPNDRGPMVRITPWCGLPLTCSQEHKWPTRRGLVMASDLTIDDELIMPVRRITKQVGYSTLPETELVGNGLNDAKWIRRLGAGSGARIPLNEETGFAVGYFLSEGCVLFSYPKRSTGRIRPRSIKFTRHRDEAAYANRAVAALLPFSTGNHATRDREGCLTSEDELGGVALAEWIDTHFGHAAGKHIPDYVFDWGEDFCRGLLTGVLCGDGDKNALDRMELTTTHPSIAMQVRDIAAALGYGWASCRVKPAGLRSGRQCKEAWRLYWGREPGQQLRALIGLSTRKSAPIKRTHEYTIENGSVFIRLRKIEHDIDVPIMWDLSVDHSDHTFRTPYGSTSNTEVAAYGSVDGLKSLEEGFAQKNPDRLFIYESTAKGFNHWRTRWYAGKADFLTARSFFIGWWSGDTNRIERKDPRYSMYGQMPPSFEEREKIAKVAADYGHKVTPEQLAWIRWKEDQAGAEQDLLSQNQPWTVEESFVQSGYSFFQTRMITEDIKRVDKEAPRFRAYRYEVDGDFFNFHMVEITDADDLHMLELKVYEEPVEGGQYVIGMDPAFGRNDHKDHHVIEVYRCFADRLVQVAEYCTADVETKHAAWVLFHLTAAYKNSMANVELGGPGQMVMTEFDHLRQLLAIEMNAGKVAARGWEDAGANVRWYLYHRPDSFGAGYMANFETTWRTKQMLMHQMRGVYVSHEITIRSIDLLKEMAIVVVDDGAIGAPESRDESCKDDRVFGTALAIRAWLDWVRKDMLSQGLTYEHVMSLENGTVSPMTRAVDNIVYGFLKRMDEQSDEPPPRGPDWMEKAGLI